MTNDLEYYREINFKIIPAKKALKSKEDIWSAFIWNKTKEGQDFWFDYLRVGFNIFKKYRAQKRLKAMIDEYEALTGAKQ